MKAHRTITAAALAALLIAPAAATASAAPGLEKQDTLRWQAPKDFVIGTAVAGGGHHTSADYPEPFPHDEKYVDIIGEQFSSVSPENQAKWDYLRPSQDEYNFEAMDAIVASAQENGQVVRGHTLLWHSQNPAWLEDGDFTPDELRAILKDHIDTVVGRYAGKIQQWDVANEIFNEDGTLRTEANIWIRELGPGIVADAFRWAHEADPEAKLFLNDYSVESINAKSDAYYELAQQFLTDGVPLDGFAVQAHLGMQWGFPGDMRQNLQRFDDLGLETAVTELDVRMELDESGVPTAQQLQTQADYYRQALEACLGVDDCNSFTIWGINDTYSWVPGTFEGQGGATIMWEDYTWKPAYAALKETLTEANPGGAARNAHHPALGK
ncbi:endo-1,4-beta-xylanase [Zhihengliuella somnathii]